MTSHTTLMNPMREPYALASGGTAGDAKQQGPRLAPTAHKTACEIRPPMPRGVTHHSYELDA